MKIKNLHNIDFIAYDIPVFAQKKYLSAVSDNYGWLNFENLILPYFIRQKYGVRILLFTTSVISKNKISKEEEQTFLTECLVFLKKNLKIDYIQRPPTNVYFNVLPEKVESMPFGSYRIDLNSSEEEIFNNIHSKHKNVIRRAVKDNLSVTIDSKYNQSVVDLVNNTLHRQNIGFLDDNELKQLKENIVYFQVTKNDQIQGSAIFIWSKYAAYYMHAGSISKPSTGSMNLLHWEAIKYFKEKNINYYDFVGARSELKKGSKIEGIQKFKERFGGEKKLGYIWKKKLTLKGKLYENLIRLKLRAKNIDIIDEWQ